MLPPRLLPHRRTPWAPRVTTTQCRWASKGQARATAAWTTSSNLDGSSSERGEGKMCSNCKGPHPAFLWADTAYLWALLLLFMGTSEMWLVIFFFLFFFMLWETWNSPELDFHTVLLCWGTNSQGTKHMSLEIKKLSWRMASLFQCCWNSICIWWGVSFLQSVVLLGQVSSEHHASGTCWQTRYSSCLGDEVRQMGPLFLGKEPSQAYCGLWKVINPYSPHRDGSKVQDTMRTYESPLCYNPICLC